MFPDRVLSGMRPTGSLHLGHYHGVLKNWVRLQHEHPCLFFVADWHALTTQSGGKGVVVSSSSWADRPAKVSPAAGALADSAWRLSHGQMYSRTTISSTPIRQPQPPELNSPTCGSVSGCRIVLSGCWGL